MVETLAFILLRQTLPIQLRSLQQRECAHHIRLGKRERVLDASVNMAFCSQVDDAINLLVLHQLVEPVEVTDVHLHELIVGLVLHILQVGEVTCISQLVQIDDFVLRILVHKQAHHMTSNEASTTCNHNVSLEFHNVKHYSFLFSGCKVTNKRGQYKKKSPFPLFFQDAAYLRT